MALFMTNFIFMEEKNMFLKFIKKFMCSSTTTNATPTPPPTRKAKTPNTSLSSAEKKKQSFEYNLRLAKELNEDLLHSGIGICCSKCAPFSNRIFSYSGKDTRFPKFSEHITKPEEYCCLNFTGIYYYDKMKLTVYKYDANGNVTQKDVDAIKHSNRPFVDNRSEYEIKVAEKHQKRMEKLRNK
jgi:hypothetical protein